MKVYIVTEGFGMAGYYGARIDVEETNLPLKEFVLEYINNSHVTPEQEKEFEQELAEAKAEYSDWTEEDTKELWSEMFDEYPTSEDELEVCSVKQNLVGGTTLCIAVGGDEVTTHFIAGE